MYSVVLMAALTAGTSTPAWGWGHGSKGCHGGWGGKHGSYGASAYSLCYGCYGGYGCYGWYNGCYGCSGGYGFGCYGSGSTYAAGCYGGGCYGAGCYGASSAGCGGGTAHPPSQVTPPAGPSGAPAPEPVPAPKKEQKITALGQAILIVTLPADAKLYVDDKLTTATSRPARVQLTGACGWAGLLLHPACRSGSRWEDAVENQAGSPACRRRHRDLIS